MMLIDQMMIQFEPKHVSMMDVRDEEKFGALSRDDSTEWLDLLAERSEIAITIMYDGKILCSTGFWTLWPGVGECWSIPSNLIDEAPLVYARSIKIHLNNIMKTEGLHRMQTTSLANKKHRRWLEFLGFELEGTMKQFTFDKKDYHIWGKVL